MRVTAVAIDGSGNASLPADFSTVVVERAETTTAGLGLRFLGEPDRLYEVRYEAPPGVHLAESEALIECTGRPVRRVHVQRRRAQAPLQHRRQKRASKAGALVVGIDEQLVDAGAAGG